MSRSDRRRPPEGLADLPIRHPGGPAEHHQPGEPDDDRVAGTSASPNPTNLELFGDLAPAQETPDRGTRTSLDAGGAQPVVWQPVVDETLEESASFVDAEDSGRRSFQAPEQAFQEPEQDGPPDLAASAAAVERGIVLDHLFASTADALVHVAVLSTGVLAMILLGLEPGLDQWPGFLAFLLLFSLLYFTLPLAFFGHSPGMAWRRLRARDPQGRPLTFGQTALRFVAAWLTVALAGLPLLVALTRSTFADRLSGSTTVRRLPATPF